MKQIPLQSPIKIKYKAFPQNSRVLWPIIDINLTYKKISLPQRVGALVDSGANGSILHPFVAELLGFNLKKLGSPKQKGFSASGTYESWQLPQPLILNIYGYIFQCNFTVINNKDLIWPCILGENSIFEFARLDFQKFKGYFEIRFRTDIH